jgi:hypothetical protein
MGPAKFLALEHRLQMKLERAIAGELGQPAQSRLYFMNSGSFGRRVAATSCVLR